MVSVLASSVVNRGFESRSGQTKKQKIGICCFSAKHETLKRKNEDCLTQNQDNVSKWSDMSIHELLFQWDITMKIQLSVDLIIILLKINLFLPWYGGKIAELA